MLTVSSCSTVNRKESVARGCAMQAAKLAKQSSYLPMILERYPYPVFCDFNLAAARRSENLPLWLFTKAAYGAPRWHIENIAANRLHQQFTALSQGLDVWSGSPSQVWTGHSIVGCANVFLCEWHRPRSFNAVASTQPYVDKLIQSFHCYQIVFKFVKSPRDWTVMYTRWSKHACRSS